jgi:hypothetical protein
MSAGRAGCYRGRLLLRIDGATVGLLRLRNADSNDPQCSFSAGTRQATGGAQLKRIAVGSTI